MARLRLIFQLVRMVGSVAGSTSLVKKCTWEGRNERSMSRRSLDTLFMPSRASTMNTGPPTASTASAITSSRGKRNGRRASRASTLSLMIASSAFISSRLPDHVVVGELGKVARVDGELEHVPEGGLLAFPRGLDVVEHPPR